MKREAAIRIKCWPCGARTYYGRIEDFIDSGLVKDGWFPEAVGFVDIREVDGRVTRITTSPRLKKGERELMRVGRDADGEGWVTMSHAEIIDREYAADYGHEIGHLVLACVNEVRRRCAGAQ